MTKSKIKLLEGKFKTLLKAILNIHLYFPHVLSSSPRLSSQLLASLASPLASPPYLSSLSLLLISLPYLSSLSLFLLSSLSLLLTSSPYLFSFASLLSASSSLRLFFSSPLLLFASSSLRLFFFSPLLLFASSFRLFCCIPDTKNISERTYPTRSSSKTSSKTWLKKLATCARKSI
jgi:hypothetical protein